MEKEKLEVYSKLRSISNKEGKKPIFISFSKLDKFNKCPLSYRIEYIDKVKVEFKDNVHSSIGTLCHDLIEWGITGNLSRKEIMETFEERVKIIMTKYEFEKELPVITSLREFFKNSNFIQNNIGKNIKFEVPVYYKLKMENKEYDYWVVGFIDMVLENEDGTVTIIDFKTSNKSGYTGVKLQQALVQIYSYAYMYEYLYRKRITQVGYHFLKYADIEFIDTNGKKRKTSKVERKNIQEEFENKNGASDLVMKDSYSLFEYNKENRLEYMGKLVELFKTVNSMNYSDFTSDKRDIGYCERFCPFKNHEKCTASHQEDYGNIFKNETMKEILKVALKNDNDTNIVW